MSQQRMSQPSLSVPSIAATIVRRLGAAVFLAAMAVATLAGATALLTVLTGSSRLAAHEGHDHGAPPPPLPLTLAPRISVHSDAYELVAVAGGERLTIYLDRYATNAPVADARIEIIAGSARMTAAAQADGTYSARLPALTSPGRHELVFDIKHSDGDDLLAGLLEISAAAAGDGAATTSWSWPSPGGTFVQMLLVLAALAAGFVLGRNRRGAAALAVMLAFSLALGIAPASAHDVEKGPNGGPMLSSGDNHIELVAKGTAINVYLFDRKHEPIAAGGGTGRAIVQAGGKTTTVTLVPDTANRLVGKSEVPLTAGARAVISATTAGGVSMVARFALR